MKSVFLSVVTVRGTFCSFIEGCVMGDARKSLVYAFEMLSKTTCYYKKFLRKIRLLSYVSYVCLHDTL